MTNSKKEDIYGWKCRLIQIDDTIRFLEQQKRTIEETISDLISQEEEKK